MEDVDELSSKEEGQGPWVLKGNASQAEETTHAKFQSQCSTVEKSASLSRVMGRTR